MTFTLQRTFYPDLTRTGFVYHCLLNRRNYLTSHDTEHSGYLFLSNFIKHNYNKTFDCCCFDSCDFSFISHGCPAAIDHRLSVCTVCYDTAHVLRFLLSAS